MRCPGCKSELEMSGELDIDGRMLPIYQCDSCTRTVDFDGRSFEAALTFAVDPDGRLLDPETFDPLNLLRPPSAT